MLQARFKEGLELSSKGQAELILPDDNPDALLILLYFIHAQTKKVPLKVGLSMLNDLAILVDKYELLDITEPLADFWMKNIRHSIPKDLNMDLLSWICISWVFKRSDIFAKVTKVAQLKSEGLLEENLLPIPEKVLGTKLIRSWSM